ncbi:MAG TPA: glucosaminidase [Porphyromonadaceae bacterium]|nr:glucosaminidase [Porphyromonadaceae bacterium]
MKKNPFISKKTKFVKQLFEAASEAAKAFDLNPSIILAQAAIESAWGESGMATTCCNYFGIIACGKPNNYWHGGKSKTTSRGLCFRRYASAQDSFMDYGRLLRVQYPRVAELSFFPESFAQAISYSAYISETNGDDRPRYRKMLVSIERDISEIIKTEGLLIIDSRKQSEAACCSDYEAA